MASAICEHCRGEFSRPRRDLERHARHFCSKKCHNDAKRAGPGAPTVKLACDECRTLFVRLKRRAKQAEKHFCTIACRNRHLVSMAQLAGLTAGLASPQERSARSRAGGLARMATLSPEQRAEFAAVGTRARLESPTAARAAGITRRFGRHTAFGVRLGRSIE